MSHVPTVSLMYGSTFNIRDRFSVLMVKGTERCLPFWWRQSIFIKKIFSIILPDPNFNASYFILQSEMVCWSSFDARIPRSRQLFLDVL